MSSTSRKHVRTGCQICKTRHLKCDEGIPTCRNCSSAGWKCEYVAPAPIARRSRRKEVIAERNVTGSGISSSTISAPSTPGINLYRPSAAVSANENDLSDFRYFQEATEHQRYHYFASVSWSRIALQMSYHEPAVRDALYALGALLNESTTSCRDGYRSELNCSTRALHQYTRAISRVNRGFSSEPLSPRVTLILCLAFVWIEILRNNVDLAIAHCRGGLTIIAGMTETPPEEFVEPCILQGFTRLRTQVQIHGNPTIKLEASDAIVGDVPCVTIPPSFADLHHSREHLEDITLSSFRSIRRLKLLTGGSARIPQDRTSPELLDAICDIYTQKDSLAQWYSAFLELTLHRPRLPLQEMAAISLLEIQYTTQSLMLACLEDESEMCFDADAIREGFQHIVDHAKRFLAYKRSETCFGLSMDTGLLPQLFFVALKCRVTELRLTAIDIMRACPQQEGMWHRDRLIQIAEWKAQKEGVDIEMPSPEARICRETTSVVPGVNGRGHVVKRYRQGIDQREVLEAWDDVTSEGLASMSDMI